MAKLEFYRQQTIAKDASNPSVGGLGRIGANWERVASNVADAAYVMNKRAMAREEDEASIHASATIAEARRFWLQRDRELQDAAIEAGEFDGYAGRLSEEFEQYAAETVKQMKTPAAQAWATERLSNIGLDLFDRGMAFEAKAKVDRDIQLVGQSLDAGRSTVDYAPDEYDAVREDLMLQYSRLPGDVRAKAWQEAEQKLAYSATVGALLKDPAAVKQALESKPGSTGVTFIEHLNADNRVRLRDAADAEIKRREAEAERAVVDARNATMIEAFAALDQNGGDLQALMRDRPGVFDSLPGDDKVRLNEYAGMVATGATRLTDWQAYGMLVNDPALLKQTNLEAMRDKFNAREYGQLLKMQQDLIADPGVEQNVRQTSTLLTSMLRDAGIKGEEEQTRFYSLLQEAVDQEMMATGKAKLPQARVRELANDLIVDEITHRGMLWNTEQKPVEMEVPAEERVQIEAALAEQGLPVSEYNVLQAYRAKLRRQNASE